MGNLYDYEKDFDPNEFEPGKAESFYMKLRENVQSYVDKHTREGIGDMVVAVPDFFYMLIKLMGDDRVPSGNKVQIGAAIAYFLSPVDIMPDFIPGLGWLDDLYLAMIVTDNLINSVDISVIQQYWMGDDDIVHFIKVTLDRLNEKLGMGAINRILEKVGFAPASHINEEEGVPADESDPFTENK